MNTQDLPNKLKDRIASQRTDFITKSSKKSTAKQAIPTLLFMLLFLSVLAYMIFNFVNPIIEEKQLDFDSSNSITKNLSELKFLIIPSICFGIFLVVGIGQLIKAIKLFFDKGTYFVGTEKELIIYRNNNILTKKWSEFSGKTSLKQKNNFGNLILELNTKKATNIIIDEDIYEDNVDEGIIQETITMNGIRNVMNIESKCKYRIEENSRN